MSPDRQVRYLEETVSENPFVQLAYVTDVKGNKITENVTQAWERGLYKDFGKGENFSDREWFIQPMKTGLAHVTDFYMSRITQRCASRSRPRCSTIRGSPLVSSGSTSSSRPSPSSRRTRRREPGEDARREGLLGALEP